ncbi:unnamed protein product [Clonostachys rosea]|uniref:TEA domain-containing protein n=1 Tax=Bionectria ochroleuca TaxID=29856 RepID=A0ABY6TTA4_BIOOC|nr:unnamed protein product [Clonostachys rosea]
MGRKDLALIAASGSRQHAAGVRDYLKSKKKQKKGARNSDKQISAVCRIPSARDLGKSGMASRAPISDEEFVLADWRAEPRSRPRLYSEKERNIIIQLSGLWNPIRLYGVSAESRSEDIDGEQHEHTHSLSFREEVGPVITA